MAAKSLTVEARSEKGKNACRRIRETGAIPAVLYSHGTSEAVQINKKEFFKLFKGHISESVLFDLVYSGGKHGADQMAFVKDYQKDPVSGELLHLDLFKVTANEKIHTTVPVELTGVAKGIKMGGVMDIGDREVVIECFPKDLPEKIIFDVTNVSLGEIVHARDLNLGNGVKLLSNPDVLILSVHVPKAMPTEEELAAKAAAAVEAMAAANAAAEKESE